MDGALNTQPGTRPVLPERNTSASSMQSPPASAEATRVSSLSLGLARPGARRKSTWQSTSSPRPRCWARVNGRISPASATRRWSSKAIRMRPESLRGSIYWVLLVSGWFSVQKPLSQIHGSTLSPLQQTPNTRSFGGFGFRSSPKYCRNRG